MKKLLPLVLALSMLGCAASQIHPGAVNGFDSHTYDALVVVQSVIDTTKADLAAGSFNATLTPKVKAALNDLITAYNLAEDLYVQYHNAAIAGKATTAQATTVSNAVQAVNNATTNLATAKAGN
jgi:hypothetical protein